MKHRLIVTLVLGMMTASARGESPKLHLKMQIPAAPDRTRSPERALGTIAIDYKDTNTHYCFYLPYNDGTYGAKRANARQLGLSGQGATGTAYKGGHMEIVSLIATTEVEFLADDLIKVTPAPNSHAVTLAFTATIPKQPDPSTDDEFFESFYPLPLAECPTAAIDSSYYRLHPDIQFELDIAAPSGWDLFGSSLRKTRENHYAGKLRAREISFAATRGFKVAELKASVPIRVIYKTDEFLDSCDFVPSAVTELTKWFGKYPFDELMIVETSELQRRGMPGIIGFNRPRQQIFQSLQSKWLNWQQWIMSSYLAAQWYGAAVQAASPDDQWFFAGLAEFGSAAALKTSGGHYDLFNAAPNGKRLLSLNYRQAQELTAAMLRRSASLAVLTNSDGKSEESSSLQQPLVFIKQTAAISSLSQIAGPTNFSAFLRKFTQDHLFVQVMPAALPGALTAFPSPFTATERDQLRSTLMHWWTSTGWPDAAVSRIVKGKQDDGSWTATVKVTQEGSFPIPVQVSVADADGRKSTVMAPGHPDGDTVTVVTASEPVDAIADEARDTFDVDRFNNSSHFPSVLFFPGNTNTLSDEDYTILWLPFFFRRPGEQFSTALSLALFRYVNSLVALRLEYEPATQHGGFTLRHQASIPKLLMSTSTTLSQNYLSQRTAEFSVSRSPIFESFGDLSLGGNLRHRSVAGDSDSSHATYGVETTYSPKFQASWFGLKLEGEYEQAPLSWAPRFQYERYLMHGKVDMQLFNYADIAWSAFGGQMTYKGPAPDSAFFNVQNLSEAHVRLDVPNIPYETKIVSLSTDLYLPFALPLPGDSMILSRNLRWLFYYDVGRAFDSLRSAYRAAGTGLHMPFGGELSGVGPLALTKLSLVAVLYSAIDDDVSTKPRLLFDFAGQL